MKEAEDIIQKKFKKLVLVCKQAHTKPHSMTACTLQVQLCEYRQFRHSIARLKYGLPDDETMRAREGVTKTKIMPEDFVELNESKKCVEFDIPVGGEKVHLEVPLQAVRDRKMVAARVAAICFVKIRDGMSKQDAAKLRDEILEGFREGEDVQDDSEAWAACRVNLSGNSPIVTFHYEDKTGKKSAFQTTVKASGESILEAERVARLCWVRLKKGARKEDVIEYRKKLYQTCAAEHADCGSRPSKIRKITEFACVVNRQ